MRESGGVISLTVNGEPAESDGSLAALLASQGVADRRGVAVALNGEVVPAAAWSDVALAPGDTVEIVRPFGGG